MPKGPLTDFWEFVTQENDILAWVAKAAIAAPLADLILNVGPPWPHRGFVIAATVLVEVLVYIAAYALLVNRSKKLIRGVLCAGLVAVVAAGIVYTLYFTAYVVPAPDWPNFVVVGTELRDDVKKLHGNAPPAAKDLLENAGRNPEAVWTEDSLLGCRRRVFFAWLTTYGLVTSVFSSFVLLRR